jgi:hypothetical protein
MLLWPIAFFIGIVLGMFGAGGGMITVPALIYFADMPVKEAVAMSLWIVAFASVVALFQNKAWRSLQYKLLLTLGISGVIGSVSGSMFAYFLPEQLQLGFFTILILLVTWWVTKMELSDRVGVYRFIPATGAGFFIGFLTGIFGVGGGFLLVPALIYLGMHHFPTAVAHSLVLIAVNALAGGLSYLNQVDIPLVQTMVFALLASAGTVLGSYILRRVDNEKLQKSFSVVLITLAILMAWRTVTV